MDNDSDQDWKKDEKQNDWDLDEKENDQDLDEKNIDYYYLGIQEQIVVHEVYDDQHYIH